MCSNRNALLIESIAQWSGRFTQSEQARWYYGLAFIALIMKTLLLIVNSCYSGFRHFIVGIVGKVNRIIQHMIK